MLYAEEENRYCRELIYLYSFSFSCMLMLNAVEIVEIFVLAEIFY